MPKRVCQLKERKMFFFFFFSVTLTVKTTNICWAWTKHNLQSWTIKVLTAVKWASADITTSQVVQTPSCMFWSQDVNLLDKTLPSWTVSRTSKSLQCSKTENLFWTERGVHGSTSSPTEVLVHFYFMEFGTTLETAGVWWSDVRKNSSLSSVIVQQKVSGTASLCVHLLLFKGPPHEYTPAVIQPQVSPVLPALCKLVCTQILLACINAEQRRRLRSAPACGAAQSGFCCHRHTAALTSHQSRQRSFWPAVFAGALRHTSLYDAATPQNRASVFTLTPKQEEQFEMRSARLPTIRWSKPLEQQQCQQTSKTD